VHHEQLCNAERDQSSRAIHSGILMEALPPLANFLIAHGNVLLLPLAVIEGPIVSFIAGILSAEGYLDWYWAISLLTCGDLIGDAICYCIGRSGGAPFAWLGRRFGLREDRLDRVAEGLRHNATKMLFIGKWTHSIGALVLISAGMARVRLAKFMLVNLIATVPKSAVLFGAGYFAPAWYGLLTRHWILGSVLLAVAGVSVALIVLRRLLPWPGFFSGGSFFNEAGR
jgi:membrane-associated protein